MKLFHRFMASSRKRSPIRKRARSQQVSKSPLAVELLEDRLVPANNISILTGGLTSIPAGASTFVDTADYIIDPVALENAGSVVLRANNDVLFQSAVNKSAAGDLLAEAGRKIVVNSNVTTSGDLTLNANQGTPTAGNFVGIDVNGAMVQVTGAGSLTLRGRGGDGATGSQYGVYVHNLGQVQGGSGAVIVIGAGGASTSSGNNRGVYVTSSGAAITSSGGNVQVTGTGGGAGTSGLNAGVYLEAGGRITAGGAGTVTVNGAGGPTSGGSNHGVVAATSSMITSSGGAVQVTGNGSFGVYADSQSQITAGGLGTVTVIGQGTATTGSSHGVAVFDPNTSITSNGGAVQVTGTGGSAGSSSGNRGVYLDFGGKVTAGGTGMVTVIGTGGPGNNSNYGVYVNSSASTITSSAGAVLVTGTGGGSGSNNYGVWVNNGRITASSGGGVTVTGTGGPNSTGSNNYGVHVTGSTAISSSGGPVAVSGTGGGAAASAGGINYGVYVASAGLVTAGGSGSVTVNGTGGASAGNSNHGVIIETGEVAITSSGGAVQVTGTGFGNGYGVSVGGQINAGGSGTVSVTGTGGSRTGAIGVYVIGNGSLITSSGGAVQVTGAGGGTGTSGASTGVFVVSGGKVSAGGSGAVTVTGTGGAGSDNGNIGVVVSGGSAAITSSGGGVQVTGTGGGAGTNGLNTGVSLNSFGQISAGGSGAVTINGTGGSSSGGSNHGVLVATSARITSGGGAVQVTGRGQYGVYVDSQAVIDAGGMGAVTVVGNGIASSSSSMGIMVRDPNSAITSNGGPVSITGVGGGVGGGGANRGVSVESAGKVTAGGAGTVTVSGTGGVGTGGMQLGVFVHGANSTITSGGGAVQVNGTGGTGGGNNNGIDIQSGGRVTAGGSGSVTVTGAGGSGTAGHLGVMVFATGSTITSSGGNVRVTGTGGSGTGSGNYGISVATGAKVTAGAGGAVAVIGTGGAGSSGNNFGVYVNDIGAAITASGADVSVEGIGGAGANSPAIKLDSEGAITSVGGNVTLIGDSMNIAATTNIGAGVNAVTLRPRTNGLAIDLGGADSSGTLGLTDAELNRITAGTLRIGNVNADRITVTAPIGLAGTNTLELTTSNSLVVPAGGSLAVALNGAGSGQFDQVLVNGGVVLNGGTVVPTLGFVPQPSDQFIIIANDGVDPVTGTFAGLPQGATLNLGGTLLTIRYDGGDGNDVVLLGNQPPVAVAGGPYNVAEGGSVLLNGSQSFDPENGIAGLSYLWDLDDDGIFGESGGAAQRGQENLPNPTYFPVGLNGPTSVGIRLRVRDALGAVSSDSSATINVLNAAPTVFAQSFTVSENSAFGTLVGKVTATDPGGDPLSLSIAAGNTANTFSMDSAGQIRVQNPIDYEAIPVHSLVVKATDNGGLSHTAGITVYVQNLGEGNVFTVTTTNDVVSNTDGVLSLREAIQQANSTPNPFGGKDEIRFAIPGPGPFVIKPTSVLPTISQPVFINGPMQIGAPLIELDGSLVINQDGLVISAGDSVIRGLAVHGFRRGIVLTNYGNNTIEGNYIGIRADGATSVSNQTGIHVEFSSRSNKIGGGTTTTANVISGNAQGLVLDSPDNSVFGNNIGVLSDGQSPRANGLGILVNGNANRIGGEKPGEPNIIAFSTDVGVRVLSTTGTLIRGNSIHSNGSLGIQQATPVARPSLLVATSDGRTITFKDGSLYSLPNRTFVIDFYSDVASNAGLAEGRIHLGSTSVTTNAAGVAMINVSLSRGATPGDFVTATATDFTSGGNTSEFGNVIVVGSAPSQDGDGVSDAVEANASNGGDGNGDGISDVLQSNVTSLPSAQDNSYVTLASPVGTRLTAVDAIEAIPPGAPAGLQFTTGLLAFTIENLSGIPATTLTLYFAPNKSYSTYYKFGLEPVDNPATTLNERTVAHWYNFMFDPVTGTGAMIDNVAHRITLYFRDGQRGDDDLSVNGTIKDDGAPGVFNNLPTIEDQSFTISENSPTGTQVGSVIAVDEDAGHVLNFALIGNAGPFAIHPATGQITVANNAVLDFETQSTYILNVEVTDNSSPSAGSSSARVAVTLNNLLEAPTATLNGPADGVRGQARTFTLGVGFADAAAAPTFGYEIDWNGDGAFDQTVPGANPTTVDHVFPAAGSNIVRMRVVDSNGLSSAPVSHTIAISGVALQPDETNPSKSVLVVGGTTGNDVIEVNPGTDGAVQVFINSVSVGVFSPTGRIAVFAQGGNDDLQVAGSIALPAWLNGDAGNDRLKGGAAHDVLIGGEGDDLIVGGDGRDLIIGGYGSDRLVGNADEDILIAGRTTLDSHAAAIVAIMAEWTSGHSYTERMKNLQGDTSSASYTSRANQNFFLVFSGNGYGHSATVFDDGVADVLTGSSGTDWFFANLDVGVFDKITDLHAAEFAADLDFINDE